MVRSFLSVFSEFFCCWLVSRGGVIFEKCSKKTKRIISNDGSLYG